MENLNNYNVTELKSHEIEETTGGFLWFVAFGAFLLVSWWLDGAFDSPQS